jgi:hypothetical protein
MPFPIKPEKLQSNFVSVCTQDGRSRPFNPLRPTGFLHFGQSNFLKFRGFDSFPQAKKVNADALPPGVQLLFPCAFFARPIVFVYR